jgi:guanosine-3',5'-bis(diphosphate) 3'-pyrophosphohydrolase
MAETLPGRYRPLLEAVAFAARAHRGHFRKDGATPYVSHVFRVCLIVRDLFGVDDHRVLQAALLHDTIEDTRQDFDDLAEAFGTEVAGWVDLLSKDKRKPEPLREQDYLARLGQAPWQVQVCKLADIVDNLLDLASLSEAGQRRARERANAVVAEFARRDLAEVRPALALVRQLL